MSQNKSKISEYDIVFCIMHFFICLEMFSSEHVLLTLQILHDFFCICTCLFTWQMFVVCVDCELLNSEKNIIIIKFD